MRGLGPAELFVIAQSALRFTEAQSKVGHQCYTLRQEESIKKERSQHANELKTLKSQFQKEIASLNANNAAKMTKYSKKYKAMEQKNKNFIAAYQKMKTETKNIQETLSEKGRQFTIVKHKYNELKKKRQKEKSKNQNYNQS